MTVLAELLVPYKRRGYDRLRLERQEFHDPVLANMAMVARLLEAHMAAPTYVATIAEFTPAAGLQTAIAVVTTATDYGLMLLGWSIGYGASAAGTGASTRPFKSDGTTAGTSSGGTISQQSGLTVNTTGMSAAANFTIEPTVKTYLHPAGELQPFGGWFDKPYDNIQPPDFFVSGKTTFGVQHTPPASTPTTPSLVFCRC